MNAMIAWPRVTRRVSARRRVIPPEKALGLAFVVLAHLGGGYALWQATPRLLPPELAPVFVQFVAPEVAREVAVALPRPTIQPPPAHRPPPVTPAPTLLADPTPLPVPVASVAPAVVAVAPPPVSVPAPVLAPVEQTALPAAEPLALGGELAVTCRHRPAPAYPAAARRRGEEGRVVLRVELDERGQISNAAVATASGSRWLDEAALAAVRKWSCEPARRGGEVVRATAQQAFSFVLAGGATPGAGNRFD